MLTNKPTVSFKKDISDGPISYSIWTHYTEECNPTINANNKSQNNNFNNCIVQNYNTNSSRNQENDLETDFPSQKLKLNGDELKKDSNFHKRKSVEKDHLKIYPYFQRTKLNVEMNIEKTQDSGRERDSGKKHDQNEQMFKEEVGETTMIFDEIKFNEIVERYLNILDKWQQEVYDIRIAHHDIWKNSRVSKIIKQHRAGSRVESQTRILPQGKDTDVDYMFELSGVLINSDENRQSIFWIPSAESCSFGSVFVESDFIERITGEFEDILTLDSFEWDNNQNAFMLLPAKFKENVVKASLFEFYNYSKVSATCPSIAGKGAVNEYDTVPCLKLSKWPFLTEAWLFRGPNSDEFVFDSKWKRTIYNKTPIFLVPTGNPMSENKEKQFRLSFSMAEIQCFSQITATMRKNYGIFKYVFKCLFCTSNCDLLSSYHVKTIFLWQCEQLSIKKWEHLSPLAFIKIMFSEIKSCVLKQNIQHFFISFCNIFPLHKLSNYNLKVYNDIFDNETEMICSAVMMLIKSDLVLQDARDENMFAMAESKLTELAEQERMERYIAGYLTRLLSMIIFSLLENDKSGNLPDCIENVRKVFEVYESNPYLSKLINMINTVIVRIQTSNKTIIRLIPGCCTSSDDVSVMAHVTFELYLLKQYDDIQSIINGSTLHSNNTATIGVSITKYHKCYDLDIPLHFVINELEKRMGFCPRFYLDPYLMIQHLKIQTDLRKQRTDFSSKEFNENIVTTAMKLSEKEPYIGKLSYKFCAVLLLHGYKMLFSELGIGINIEIPDIDSFNQRLFATNFDLR